MAQWLNTTFAGLDGAVFGFMNSIKCGFLTWISEIFDVLGSAGIAFILAGLVLCAFSKTRKIGAHVLFSIVIGALFTNVIIKPLVARPRPYTNPDFVGFWEQVGASLESEKSFPSGHTTSATACLVAIFISCDKKWSWVALPFTLIMAFTRVYLIVHYTTDVIGGLLVGTVAAVAGYYLTQLVYRLLKKFSHLGICRFVLYYGVVELFNQIFTKDDRGQNKKEQIEDNK